VKEGIGWKTDQVDTAEVTAKGELEAMEGGNAEGDTEEEGKVEAMEGGNIESNGQLQEVFGNTLGFPTC